MSDKKTLILVDGHALAFRQFFALERTNMKKLNKFAVIMIDVNGLKRANDHIGHEAGDELIKGTASCLYKIFSSSILDINIIYFDFQRSKNRKKEKYLF